MFRLDREAIALRVAKEFRDGDVVNLGIGIPTLAGQLHTGRPDCVVPHRERGRRVWGLSAGGRGRYTHDQRRRGIRDGAAGDECI